MAYRDFNLKMVKNQFGLELIENQSLFSDIEPRPISDYLQQTLKRNVALAQAINTEKARSELIIINVLLEAKSQFSERISLFSGIEFTVDKEQGLAGFCDYIISASPEQFYLEAPVLMVAEAKNENIVAGFGQCSAEMFAAQLYNTRENKQLSKIYGVVTTGNEWKFLQLCGQTLFIDQKTYYINEIEKLIGILTRICLLE